MGREVHAAGRVGPVVAGGVGRASQARYLPIAEHGLIGDLHTVALVGTDGTACHLVGGELTTSDESLEVGFFTPAEIEAMPVHESIRLRIRHYLEHRPQPVIA
jgi:hypothetical protein